MVLFAVAGADQDIGHRLKHGHRVLICRPTELRPLLELHQVLTARAAITAAITAPVIGDW